MPHKAMQRLDKVAMSLVVLETININYRVIPLSTIIRNQSLIRDTIIRIYIIKRIPYHSHIIIRIPNRSLIPPLIFMYILIRSYEQRRTDSHMIISYSWKKIDFVHVTFFVELLPCMSTICVLITLKLHL